MKLLERRVKQLMYRSGKSVGETYRLLGDILDEAKEELRDDEKEVIKRCRSYLQSSMDVLELLKKL